MKLHQFCSPDLVLKNLSLIGFNTYTCNIYCDNNLGKILDDLTAIWLLMKDTNAKHSAWSSPITDE